MKRLLLVVGCAVGLMSCVYSDNTEREEPPGYATFGPGSEEEQCPLLEPTECRSSGTCRQQGQCVNAGCQQIEITGCIPVDFGTPAMADGECGSLGAAGCATRSDCLSATSLGGQHVCLPQNRTEDTHIIDEGNRVLVNVIVDEVR